VRPVLLPQRAQGPLLPLVLLVLLVPQGPGVLLGA
jgi:hypothetical protein